MRVETPSLEEVETAAARLAPHIASIPLVRLDDNDSSSEIYLKLENLQPGGSFKIRPMGNVVLSLGKDARRQGIYTASSGNSGLALASIARNLGIASTVYAPRSAPDAKLRPIRECGARVVSLSEEAWWQIIRSCGHEEDPGRYIDAVRDRSALAGNGTIGVEIVAQLPDVETVIVPFGGGGVACGIASALAALKPGVRVIVAECETATPATSALRAGAPVKVKTTPSFISGAGAPCVLNEMWPLVSRLVSDTIVVSLSEVEEAIRRLARRKRVVVEGAGAVALAAAMRRDESRGRTVCIITGGNIDLATFARIVREHPVAPA